MAKGRQQKEMKIDVSLRRCFRHICIDNDGGHEKEMGKGEPIMRFDLRFGPAFSVASFIIIADWQM